jgi:hypothetical protein
MSFQMFSTVGSSSVGAISKDKKNIPPGTTLYLYKWSMSLAWGGINCLLNVGYYGYYTTMLNGILTNGSATKTTLSNGILRLTLSGTSYPMIHGNYDISGNVYVDPSLGITLNTYECLFGANNPAYKMMTLPAGSGGMYLTLTMPQYFKLKNPYSFLGSTPSTNDRTYIIQGSNDGVTWITLTPSIVLNSTVNDSLSVPVLPNISVYKQFKWVFSNSTTNTTIKFLDLIGDFYI